MNKVTQGVGHDGTPRFRQRVDIDGVRRQITARSRRELQDKIKQAREDAARGTLAGSNQRLDTFMEAWLANGEKTKAASTNLSYRQLWDKYIKGQLGHYRLCDLRLSVLQPWVDGLGKDDTKRRAATALRACLQTAVDWDELDRNPCLKLKLPDKPRPHGRRWDVAQTRAFWGKAREHPYHAYFALALAFPARPEEVLGLRWRNVDMATGTLKIVEVRATFAGKTVAGPPKTDASRREVKIGSHTVAVLQAWKAAQNEQRLRLGQKWAGEDYVCTGPKGGPLHYSCIDHAFRELAAKAGLPALGLYQLRHTAISNLKDLGYNSKLIAELAGHASVRSTENIYWQTRTGEGAEAVAHLGGLYHGPTGGAISGSGG